MLGKGQKSRMRCKPRLKQTFVVYHDMLATSSANKRRDSQLISTLSVPCGKVKYIGSPLPQGETDFS